MEEPLSYEQWYGIHEFEITCELADSGADRELDFNPEREFEDRYDIYVEKFYN